jgi:transposase
MKKVSKTTEHWAGLDWSENEHVVKVIAQSGAVAKSFAVPNTLEGFEELESRLRAIENLRGIGVEASRALVVNWLVQRGFTVYPINPKLTAAWRKGTSVSEAKSDEADALVIARGIARNHEEFKALKPDTPLVRELALLCEDETHWIAQRTALVNRLKATLKMYYPAVLEWFEDWTSPTAWYFVRKYSTPQALASEGEQELVAFLKGHRVRYTKRRKEVLNRFRESARLQADEATVRAMALRVETLADQLLKLEESLQQYRERIDALFAQHPDAAVFSSLPGAGKKLAPRLASMFGTDRNRFEGAHVLQQISGAAPVSRTSGRMRQVLFRWRCNKIYRNTLYLFALTSINECGWARRVYDYHRARNDSHALALRKVAYKWLNIIFRMWQNQEPYHEGIYLDALRRSGSHFALPAA